LSTLVMPEGKVTSVELQWDLAEKATNALRAGGFQADVVVGDAQHGRYGDDPFDRIIATASTDHIPRTWFEQLMPKGLIVLPVRIASPGPWSSWLSHSRRSRTGSGLSVSSGAASCTCGRRTTVAARCGRLR
jgi:protein-L-isoaspartate O-methyltransferase